MVQAWPSNSKKYLIILPTFLMLSCGVKGPPVPYPNTQLPSPLKRYTETKEDEAKQKQESIEDDSDEKKESE